METAVAMVRLAAEHGTGIMVATPHAIGGLYDTTRDQVLRALEELRTACAAEGLPMRLLPGQEIAMESDLAARLRGGELCTLADTGRAALIEVPAVGFPPYWERAFFDLTLAGITPVVAHAERTTLTRDAALAARVVELGGRLQVNSRVLGAPGAVQRAVHGWVRNGWVACLGSDAHDLRRRPPVLDEAVRAAGRLDLDGLLSGPELLRLP